MRTSHDILTVNEERELLLAYKNNGNREAYDKLALHNQRLVVRLAVTLRNILPNASLTLDDLIQEGNMGMLKAIEKFDISRSNRFATYATWYIRKYMYRAVRGKNPLISIPYNVQDEHYFNRNKVNKGEKPKKTRFKHVDTNTIIEASQTVSLSHRFADSKVFFKSIAQYDGNLMHFMDSSWVNNFLDYAKLSLINRYIFVSIAGINLEPISFRELSTMLNLPYHFVYNSYCQTVVRLKSLYPIYMEKSVIC